MAQMVTVTGTFLRADLTPVGIGNVRFSPALNGATVDPSAMLSITPAIATLDYEGNFTIEVVASDDDAWGTDGPVAYSVSVEVPGFRETFSALIPAPGPVDIADLYRLA